MSAQTFQKTDSNTQAATAWPVNVDADLSVLTRIGESFAPHAQATPNMTIAIDPGHLFDGVTLTEIAVQSSSTIVAPTANPRIDRVVIDQQTGIVSVVTGVEAASPVAPSIPSGKAPVAQVLLQTSSAVITDTMITDERDLSALGRIIAVEAGTGLTGGGSSGTVMISLETPVAVDLGGTGVDAVAAKEVFIGPVSGGEAPPSWRALELSDLPSDVGTITEVKAGTGLDGGGTSGIVTISLDDPVAVALGGTGTATAAAATVFAGPESGVAAAPSFRALALADLPADVATTEELTTAVAALSTTVAALFSTVHDDRRPHLRNYVHQHDRETNVRVGDRRERRQLDESVPDSQRGRAGVLLRAAGYGECDVLLWHGSGGRDVRVRTDWTRDSPDRRI